MRIFSLLFLCAIAAACTNPSPDRAAGGATAPATPTDLGLEAEKEEAKIRK
jgi:hypothetical protein